MNSPPLYRTAPLLYGDTIKSFTGTREFGLALGAMQMTFAVISRVMAQ